MVVQRVLVLSRILMILCGFWAMYLLANITPCLIWSKIEWDLLRQN